MIPKPSMESLRILREQAAFDEGLDKPGRLEDTRPLFPELETQRDFFSEPMKRKNDKGNS